MYAIFLEFIFSRGKKSHISFDKQDITMEANPIFIQESEG